MSRRSSSLLEQSPKGPRPLTNTRTGSAAGSTLSRWLRAESGTSCQQHGQEDAGEDVKGQTETGPPQRNTWIRNHLVMKAIENSMSAEPGDHQPEVLPEAHNREHEKRGRHRTLQRQCRCGTP